MLATVWSLAWSKRSSDINRITASSPSASFPHLLAESSSGMNADLSRIVETNVPPTESQAREMQAFLASSASELSLLDEQIEAAAKTFSDLQQRRRMQRELVAGVKRALSKVRTYPAEILSEIFLICRDDALESPQYSIFDSSQAPLLLAHVSSRWRAVCMSNSRLWDHFHVHLPTSIPQEAALWEVLLQSGAVPLSIELMEPWSPTQLSLHPLFRFLMRANDRICHAELRSGCRASDVADLWTVPRDFPLLTSFTLRLPEYDSGDSGLPDCPMGLGIFKTAPLLTVLGICSPLSPLDSRPAAVTWSQLTVLVLNLHVDLLTARSIVSACVCARDCVIHFYPPVTPTQLSLPDKVVCLDHLEYLRVMCEDYECDCLLFFDAFSLPRLESLQVYTDILSPVALPNLLRRSKFQLEELTVSILESPIGTITPFLELTPSLRSLDMTFGRLDDDIFEAFTQIPDQPRRFEFELPELLCLKLSEIFNDPESLTTDGVSAVKMAESFHKYSDCDDLELAFPLLEEVSLTLNGDPFKKSIEKRLIKAGGSKGIFTFQREKEMPTS